MTAAEYAARCAVIEARLESVRTELGLSPAPAPVVGLTSEEAS